MIETLLFYLFAILTLGGAVLTVTRRSPVLSAVWLTVSLLGVAGLFLLVGAEFLFVAQIIVYIGGITLLFLFVIMLVNLDVSAREQHFRGLWPVMLIAAGAIAAELILILTRAPLAHFPALAVDGESNTSSIASLLLSKYWLAFEVLSVLLLVAIVGSVWMGVQRTPERSA